MKEFLLIFRRDIRKEAQPSPEQMQASVKHWQDWIGGIAAQNKLVNRGNRLEASGKVIRNDSTITNGPYAEIKESIGGYSVIKAESYDAAIELAKSCPIITLGGNVEVREISVMP